LEDAKTASMMTPGMLEGHMNQFRCFRALKREREAMQAINECLKRTDDEKVMGSLLSVALDIAGNVEEGTTAITAPVSRQLLVKLTNDVIKMKDWDKLNVLYLGGGGITSYPLGVGGLATNIDASSVQLGEVLRHFGPRQPMLTSTLLDNGASANAIEGSDVIPLDEAIRQEHLFTVETLVQNGANCCVASSDGEPIIHKALRIGLKTGNFRFLEAMTKSKLPEIECVQGTNGDTLYHLVCAGKKSSKFKCDAIKILRNANVNPNLPNKRNKLPTDRLYKSDSRWKMINAAMKNYKPGTSGSSSAEANPENASNNEQDQDIPSAASEDEDWSIAGELVP